MYNYLSNDAEGRAEFNDAKPYQKFKFTYQGGGAYRIETEGGKVLSVQTPENLEDDNRLIAQNKIAFDWIVATEKNELFSLRPYAESDVLMNASKHTKTNGTPITVSRLPGAPENARWRLIPANYIDGESNLEF